MDIDLRREEIAIQRALKRAADKARAAGIRNPEFFVEPEGPTIHVMDGDHPGQVNSGTASAGERQRAIVGRMKVPEHIIHAKLDVGAW